MKRALSVASEVFCILLLVLSVGMLVFTLVSVRAVGQKGTVLGYRVDSVLSDSMGDVFQAGDAVVSKQVDPATLEPGDIITFESIDPDNSGKVFTHRIRSITTYEGEPAFVTYGTATGNDDSYPVPFDNVMGKYMGAIPNLGEFLLYFKTPQGYVTVVLIPFLLLMFFQLMHFIKLFREYQKEKSAATHQQLEQMQSELERLRAQVSAQNTPQEDQEATVK